MSKESNRQICSLRRIGLQSVWVRCCRIICEMPRLKIRLFQRVNIICALTVKSILCCFINQRKMSTREPSFNSNKCFHWSTAMNCIPSMVNVDAKEMANILCINLRAHCRRYSIGLLKKKKKKVYKERILKKKSKKV
jgi:hypothetical protein